MPIDPSISLGINVPQQANPLESLNSLMGLAQKSSEISGLNALTGQRISDTQKNQLENLMTMRTISAQNALADIAQQAIDPTTGQMNPQKFFQLGATNPYTAAMMPQLMTQLRTAQQTQADIDSKRQAMAKDAFGEIFHTIASFAATGQPNDAIGAINSQLAALPEQTQKDLGPFTKYLEHGLYSNLPSDPQRAAAELKSRALPFAARIYTPEELQQYTGKAGSLDLGDRIQPTRVDAFTQEVTPVGAPQMKGLSPQYTTPDVFAAPGIHPNPLWNGGAAPAPAGTTSLSGQFQSPSGPQFGGAGGAPRFTGGAGAPAPSASPATSRPTYAGRPLDAGLRADPSITASSVAGNPIQSPGDRETNQQIASYMGEAGSREYNNAQTTQTLLTDMRASFARLGPDGFLAPGAAAEDRAKFGNLVNTALTAFTGPDSKWQQTLGFDPEKIASLQDIGKSSRRLAISYLTTALGVQREAAQTIQSIQQAVPNLENSPLGAQLLLNNIEALNQRQIDRYEFMRDWGNKNHGVFNNAEAAFNSAHPADEYGRTAFEKVGLNPGKGWISIDALGNALRQGWITPAQFKAMGKEQFGDDAGKAHAEGIRVPAGNSMPLLSDPQQFISNPLVSPQ